MPRTRKMSTDWIGERGELLTRVEFLRPVRKGFDRPLFRGNFLGEKYPVADLLVDLLDERERCMGFFYAQVKSTADAQAGRRKRLPVACPARKYNSLVALPVPTYLVGVDVVSERVYLLAANRPRRRDIASMVKLHDLSDDDVKRILYEDVLAYWKNQTLEAWEPRLTDA